MWRGRRVERNVEAESLGATERGAEGGIEAEGGRYCAKEGGDDKGRKRGIDAEAERVQMQRETKKKKSGHYEGNTLFSSVP